MIRSRFQAKLRIFIFCTLGTNGLTIEQSNRGRYIDTVPRNFVIHMENK